MWLKLTLHSGESILVNMNNVCEIYPTKKHDVIKSYLHFINPEYTETGVKETLDEIELMIDKQTPSI
jgi:hypothetical protein